MGNHDVPDEEQYVELTFEGEHGSQSPIRGRVTEVDTDPMSANEFEFTVDNGEDNSKIVFGGFVDNGEVDAAVARYSEFSGSFRLGGNAEWRRLG